MRKAHRLTDLMIQLDDEDNKPETQSVANRVIKLDIFWIKSWMKINV